MMFSSFEYIDENNEQVTILEKNKEKLSPISLSILDSILTKKVTIIFSQGPLNLTPIISSLFAYQKEQDVLIGIPKRLFNEYFEKNTEIFFSLIYKKKMDVGTSKAFYFYRDMLWCKGEIDDEKNELIKLDISTRPRHGTLKSKRDYDNYAKEGLTSGTFKTKPKILSIPIEETTPTGIIGEKTINFENYTYTLNNFNPKLVIYDSINERRYGFDNILQLINKAEENDIKLVLHFSWPYLKGLSGFLKKINNDININVIHLGKRFCIESHKNFIKPTPNILSLSLEGDFWENYYPKNRFFYFKIMFPLPKTNSKKLSTKDIENCDWYFDERINEIREHLKYESFNKFKDNLLRFPTFVDSFLCPSEIKVSTSINNSWTSVGINEFISINENESSPSIRAFKGLCSDLEKYRDISYELKGLYTNSAITKKTLFQTFFIEKINTNFKNYIQKNIQYFDGEASTSVIIANFHPHSYLKTQTSLVESLLYLFKSINYTLKRIKLPNIQKKENILYIEKELDNDEKLKEIIWGNNFNQEFNINNIKRFFINNIPEINVSISKNNIQLEITLRLNLSFEYMEYLQQSSIIDRKYFNGLIFYDAIIKNDGSFNENKLHSISFESKLKNSVIKTRVEHKSDISPKEIYENDIITIHTDFSNMQALSMEIIKNSELIIPGPIPFTTVSDEDIIIFHGYDALLLPFRNVIFFAYPGNNFRNIIKQAKLYNDLLSETQSNISKRDLIFSLDNIKNITRFNLPSKPESNNIPTEENQIESPFDTAFREECINESNVDENEREEIRTLKDIWNQIRKKQPIELSKNPIHTSKEHTTFCVEFESGERETLSFPVDILIRKKIGNDYILTPIDELCENDQIIYIQADERESIENYLLRVIFNEDMMSLEDILKPLTALKSFYELLRLIDIKEKYDEIKMKNLDWLSPLQKERLFNLVRILLRKDSLNTTEIFECFSENDIWYEAIKAERLIEIFNIGNKKITYEKLYYLSVEMGLKEYKKDSFKALCSTAINEQKHYSFRNENNLLVIGRLIGHQGIVDNYRIINEKGGKIRTFLQQVGHSIKRVANGKGEPLNEIDLAIEGKMRKCTIFKMGSC